MTVAGSYGCHTATNSHTDSTAASSIPSISPALAMACAASSEPSKQSRTGRLSIVVLLRLRSSAYVPRRFCLTRPSRALQCGSATAEFGFRRRSWAASPSGLSTALRVGRTRTWLASRSISSRVPVPSPRRVAFRAPAAAPSRSASTMPMPRAKPTPVAANIESPVPRRSSRFEHRTDEIDPTWLSVTVDEDCRGRATRHEHVVSARVAQAVGGSDDFALAVAGGVALGDQLIIVQAQQFDPAGERRPERRPGQIGDDQLSIDPQIAHQPAIEIRLDHIRGLAAGDQRDVSIEPRPQRHAVQLVSGVSVERPALDAHDLDSLAAATVVDVHAIRGVGAGCPQGQLRGVDQHFEHPPWLPAERAAEDDFGTERRGKSCHPEALASGMQVHLRAIDTRLDRDGQQR